jgi:adenine-specific DNA-methyltransferase
MIYCAAFKADGAEFENLSVRKIPKTILNTCAWGKKDYSLRVAMKKEADQANEAEQIVYPNQGTERNVAMAAQRRRS